MLAGFVLCYCFKAFRRQSVAQERGDARALLRAATNKVALRLCRLKRERAKAERVGSGSQVVARCAQGVVRHRARVQTIDECSDALQALLLLVALAHSTTINALCLCTEMASKCPTVQRLARQNGRLWRCSGGFGGTTRRAVRSVRALGRVGIGENFGHRFLLFVGWMIFRFFACMLAVCAQTKGV